MAVALLLLNLTVVVSAIFYIERAIKNALKPLPSDGALLKKDWKKDIVYLYQFPRPHYVPNASPFALKVETYLKSHKIPYEVIESYKLRSAHGLIPFIEFNGKHIADSRLILKHLSAHFNEIELTKSPDNALEETFIARFVDDTVLMSANAERVQDKVFDAVGEMIKGVLPQVFKYPLGLAFRSFAKEKFIENGFGRHTIKEQSKLLNTDLEAINVFLESRGRHEARKLSIAECTIFGHLAPSYFLPRPLKIQKTINTQFPLIRDFMQSVMSDYYN
uniref:Thioredoxin-like_fold domain-containing protein n=1 Tax=Panagrellus redivivus TaxID=6233 RepID=A0A7E4W6F9_PANRE